MRTIKHILICVVAWCFLPGVSSGQIYLTASDEITISGRSLDSSGFYITPDSVRIVTKLDGTEKYDTWFNSGDAQCAALNDMLVFTDVFSDIDGAGGNGLYEVMAGFFEDDGDLYNWKTIWVYVGVDMAELGKVNDSIEAWDDEVAKVNQILDTLQSQDDWVAPANELTKVLDSLGKVLDSLYAVLDSVQNHAAWTVATVTNTISINHEDMGRIADSVWNLSFGTSFPAGSMGDSLNNATYVQADVYDIASKTSDSVLQDSLSYQGGGGDSTSIASWVWNTPQGNHTVAGTFGRYLDMEVSGISSGSGMYSYSICARDSVLGQAISGVRLAVRNVSQTSLIAVGTTDCEGEANFNLDADSFVIIAAAPGYLFSPYDTVVVTGTGVDTVLAGRFDPGTPASPELCRVYGWVVDVRSEAEGSASVSASLPKGVARTGGLVVSPFSVSTQTDSLGYFYLDLIPSDSLTGEDTSYEIAISRQDGTILRKRLKVPVQTSWQLVW